MNKGRLMGCMALVASAFLWATAYIAVKQLVAEVPPTVLLAFRFSFAAIILAVICIPKYKHYSRDLLFSGMKMGTAMFFEFFLFTVALQYTSASKSSFIIASYIIILPIVYLIIRRKKPAGSDVLASVICMVGICLLLANGLESFNKGDLLSAGCALSYAVHIVYSSKFSKQYDGWLLNLTQMGTVAVLAWIATLLSGSFKVIGTISLPFGAFFFLAIFCSIIPYFLCLYGMKRVSTTTSGILLSFESVFATLLAVLMLGDPLYWQLVVGGSVIVASSIISEFFASRGSKKKAGTLEEKN